MRTLFAVFLALFVHCHYHVQAAGTGIQPAASLKAASRSQAETRQKLLAVLDSQLGVREATGRNDGPQVEAYLRTIGLGKGYAWCSAFVVWCCRQAGLKVPSYGMARSWFTPATKIWPGVPGAAPPQPCDLVGYRFVRNEVDHVGFVRFWGTSPLAETEEGNTSGKKADRDGQGVHKKWVLKSQIYVVADLFKCLKR